MATYHEIQEYIEKNYGFIPHTCWIAEVKELMGIPLTKVAPNRKGRERAKSTRCPKAKIPLIKSALEYFNVRK